ncbi:hypothetical protein ACN3XK_36575 [Actinomadura welshii]
MHNASQDRNHLKVVSPYSTGGGGTVLEHRYGALLLSHLLTGDAITELGDDITPHEIIFQASLFSAVDDIVVRGHSDDGVDHKVSIGVRRNPSFTSGDDATVTLIRSYISLLTQNLTEVTSGTWVLALVTASPNRHVQQVRQLAEIASGVSDHEQFKAEVTRTGKTTRQARERLNQLEKMIAKAVQTLSPSTALSTSELTWHLLAALRLREVRLEGNDQADRTEAVNRLRGITSEGTVAAADRLFSRLCELTGRYAPVAAIKDRSSLLVDLTGFSLVENGEWSARAKQPRPPIKNAALYAPPVRSSYLTQVRRIAPVELLDRNQELNTTAKFCTSARSKPYLWWRAKAWAGKSALLSTFALNPPPRVRIVSFFITARLAGQADRAAFCDVVLEQLLEILGEPMPPMLTDATREAHLHASLERAAEICQSHGERLILIVDGLDEDQGVTAGPDAHSIAALLPSAPPADMRIIVASRPHPPIPADVLDDHPLRLSVMVRRLSASRHAEVVRKDAERELKRLLKGTDTERDLLGLLTAAGGGLSAADLAQLTGLQSWEIEDRLHAFPSRTFMSRPGRWQQDTVYMLGHEKLQEQAAHFIGVERLAFYRDRLHHWADEYRAKRWPADTPEYLLRGYFNLLQAAGDSTRLLAHATDPDRHDRMLDLIGGDTSALAEIASTLEIISSKVDPDLIAISRLSVHRARLSARNDDIPANLPGVWAQLGRPGRAEALARSITAPKRRVQALAAVAREVASNGETIHAKAICDQAERALEEMTDEHDNAHATAVVARAAAHARDQPRAERLLVRAQRSVGSTTNNTRQAHTMIAIARATALISGARRANRIAQAIPTRSERALALLAVATEAADSGDLMMSRKIAQSIKSRSERAQAIAAVARAEQFSGYQKRAIRSLKTAESVALEIRNPSRRAWTLVSVAHAAADMGRQKKAEELLQITEQLGRQVGKSADHDAILTATARVTAITKDLGRAERIARLVTSQTRRARAISALASGLASAGYGDQAESRATEAEALARSIGSRSQTVHGLAVLAQATASAGNLDQAEKIALSISDPSQRDRTLTFVAESMAHSGRTERAIRIATSISDNRQHDTAISLIAKAVANAGEGKLAREIAERTRDSTRREKSIATLSKMKAKLIESSPIENLLALDQAPPSSNVSENVVANSSTNDLAATEAAALAITDPYEQFKALVTVARMLVESKEIRRAERCIDRVQNTQLRARAFLSIADVLHHLANVSETDRFFDRAIAIAEGIPRPAYKDRVLLEIAQRLVAAGKLERAEVVARSITTSAHQDPLLSVATAVASTGLPGHAREMISHLPDSREKTKALAAISAAAASADDLELSEDIARSITDSIVQAQALNNVTQALARAGQIGHARQVALSIAHHSEQTLALTALASEASPDEGRRFLAQALTVGHWQACLPTLMHLEPAAISAIAAEFLRTTKQTSDEDPTDAG